jgi:hypothetical protein
VTLGTIDVNHLLEAYDQAIEDDLARRNRGLDPIANRGAKFWAAFQALASVGESDLRRLASPLKVCIGS